MHAKSTHIPDESYARGLFIDELASYNPNGNLRSRDPIWRYNVRMIILNLYSAGVRFRSFLEETVDSDEKSALPSFTDTICGMLDDLAKKPSAKNLPSWWEFASENEKEFFNEIVINTTPDISDTLLSYVNECISTVDKDYCASNCGPIFMDEESTIYVNIKSTNPAILTIILECAFAVHGTALGVVAVGLDSWKSSFSSLLADFLEVHSFPEDNILVCGSSPNETVMKMWEGPIAFGANPSTKTMDFLREKVKETDGSKNSFVPSLDGNNFFDCNDDGYFILSKGEWSFNKLDHRIISKVENAPRLKLIPAP